MNRQEELAVGRRLLTHIDGRTTDLADAMFRNRVTAYSCRDRAKLERERLFRDRPIFMGLATRLVKAGDYLAEDVAGMPVLMTRGEDLLASTHVHVLLQKLLGYATPAYAHHRLLLGPDGKRLAKRDQSTSIRALRQAGKTPAEVFSLLPKD